MSKKSKKILKIGVTGSAGSGKSGVVKAFEGLGLVTFDCDQIARDLVAPGAAGYEQVVEIFSYDVVSSDRTLDRKRMREMMLADPELRRALEAVLHPLIIHTLFSRIQSATYNKEAACAVEVPLLFELGMQDRFDVTVTVTALEDDLVERIADRDKVTAQSARKMLNLQLAQEEKALHSDYVIENRGSLGELVESVGDLYRKIQKDCLTRKR